MTLSFRNVDAAVTDPVTSWPQEALQTALERGDITHWRRIVAEIGRSPWGPVASRMSTYLSGRVTPSAAMLVRMERLAARRSVER